MDRRQFLGSAAAMSQLPQTPLPPADEKVSSGAGEVTFTVPLRDVTAIDVAGGTAFGPGRPQRPRD